jgi:hypothetical protein
VRLTEEAQALEPCVHGAALGNVEAHGQGKLKREEENKGEAMFLKSSNRCLEGND